MSLYGDYEYHEPEPIREPYYDDDYSGDQDFYPWDGEDPGESDGLNDAEYDGPTVGDPVETDDPYDMREWR